MELGEKSVCVILSQCNYQGTTRPVVAILADLLETLAMRVLQRAALGVRLADSALVERVILAPGDESPPKGPPDVFVTLGSVLGVCGHLVGPVEEVIEYAQGLGLVVPCGALDYFAERALIPAALSLVQETRNDVVPLNGPDE
jgi:hypothetical protein